MILFFKFSCEVINRITYGNVNEWLRDSSERSRWRNRLYYCEFINKTMIDVLNARGVYKEGATKLTRKWCDACILQMRKMYHV